MLSLLLAKREVAIVRSFVLLLEVSWGELAELLNEILVSPLGTLVRMLIMIKLTREVEVSGAVGVVRLRVGSLSLVRWSIGDDDIHLLRLDNIFVDDIIRRMIVINGTISFVFAFLIAELYISTSLAQPRLRVKGLALVEDA